jgi:hypothetical protein
MIGRHLTTQNRVTPPQKPKKDKGHHKVEGDRQQRITGKAILSENSKACTIELSAISMKQVQQVWCKPGWTKNVLNVTF